MFLGKIVQKICSKFTEEHPCRSVTSIKLQSNFIEIALRHGCSPVNLLHIFRTPFSRNTSGWLLLKSIVLLYYSIFKVMSNGSLNLRHQSNCTNILRKSHRIARNVFSWEKTYTNFISQKYYTLAANLKVYKEAYSHQLFSILINFSPASHFYNPWNRQESLWFSDVFRGCRNVTLG